jgi:lysophospholipase L1-like esterase
MPATGVSGIDLYSKNDRGEWRWLTVGQPKEQSNNIELIAGLPGDAREFLLYLPLYNGVSELKIGVPAGESIEAAPGYPATKSKPLVFYGTSITHGACASRPGMCHPAILGRWYHRPVINLGFSGNGMMEPEVGQFLTEIDAAAYIIDCLPNMTAEQVAERTRPLVEQLRAARPETPIVLVEDRDYSNGWLIEGPRSRNRSSQSALKRAYDELVASGVERLYYIEGPELLGDDSEGTVDNSHPNDLGFMRQAEGMDKVLGPLFR